jgi:hypothetical protein
MGSTKNTLLLWMTLALFLGLGFHARPLQAEHSFVGPDVAYHSGPIDNSHIKQFTYGAVFQAETAGRLRFALGVSVRRGDLKLSLSSVEYSVISLGINLRSGLVWDPFPDNSMKPLFGVYGIGGSELLTSAAPPPDVSESQMALAYGYEGEAGIALRIGRHSSLRLLGVYRKYSFGYGGQKITADAFMGRMGLSF